VSFVSVDALERELRKIESKSEITHSPQVSAYPVEFATSVGIISLIPGR
jgi:hypothetical protein